MLRAAAGDDNREMEKSYSCFPESPDQLKHPFPWGQRGKSSLQTHRPVRLIKGSSITVRANNSGESSDKPSSGRQSLAALPSCLSRHQEGSRGAKPSPWGERQECDGSEASRMRPAFSRVSPWPYRTSSWRGCAGKSLAGEVVALCCSMSRVF